MSSGVYVWDDDDGARGAIIGVDEEEGAWRKARVFDTRCCRITVAMLINAKEMTVVVMAILPLARNGKAR